MKHEPQAPAANPFAVDALWKGGSAMNAFGGQAMRAWLDVATRLQAETTAFWTGRVGKDVAAMAALAQCTTPAAMAEAQVRYAREAWADFESEGRRLMRIVNEAAAIRLPGNPARTAG